MSLPKSDLFRHHPRSWQSNGYVYPVISRRSNGLSIGINLNPDKACNFDCIYCSVDRSTPAPAGDVNLDRLREELDHLLDLAKAGQLFSHPPFDQTPASLRRLNDIAFSGDGEPTACALFPDACRLVADRLAARGLTKVKIVLITNATLLHRPPVAAAVQFLDGHNGEIWAKLDAGTEAYYQKVDRTQISFQRILENILSAGRARPIVIQSLFMNIHGQPPPPDEIAAYVQRLADLTSAGCRIKLVQVYTTARATAEPYVTPLPAASLEAIASQVRQIHVPVEIFPA